MAIFGLTGGGADDSHRDERDEDVAFDFGSVESSLHDNERDEQERWKDEAGKGADQDPAKSLEEAARDMLVFAPAPSELV